MKDLLIELFHLSQKATIIVHNKDLWLQKYLEICHHTNIEEPPPIKGKKGKPKNSKGRNLLNRLVEHKEDVLDFAFTHIIPFTNIKHHFINQKYCFLCKKV